MWQRNWTQRYNSDGTIIPVQQSSQSVCNAQYSRVESDSKQKNIQGTGNCLKVTEQNRFIWQRLEDTSQEIDEILSEHFMLDTFFQQGFT